MTPPSDFTKTDVARIAEKGGEKRSYWQEVDAFGLPKTDQEVTCLVCSVSYYEPDEHRIGRPIELPLVTLCDHIFGHQCLRIGVRPARLKTGPYSVQYVVYIYASITAILCRYCMPSAQSLRPRFDKFKSTVVFSIHISTAPRTPRKCVCCRRFS